MKACYAAAVIGLLAALAPQPAYADDAHIKTLMESLRVSGSWRTDYFQSDKFLDDDTGFVGSTLQLKALPEVNDRLDGKFEARVTDPAIGRGGDARFHLLEGYATAHFSKADLRLGQQIVAWGRADGINPTDNLTPRDYTVMLPFEDDQRLGTPAAKLDVFVTQDHRLTFFATPFFKPSKIPLPAGSGNVIEKTPDRSDLQLGMKLDKTGAGFDWSVSAFRGNSLLPQLNLIAGGQELRYDRITVLGTDFARNYGRFGFRWEAAYVDTDDDAGTDPWIKNPYLYWIGGVDRTFFDYLNVNLQFYQRRVRNFRSASAFADPLDRSTAALNAIFNGQRDRVSNGISFRINDKWFNETLEAEIFSAINFNHMNAFMRPFVTYAFNDSWKGSVGAEIFRGPAATPYGSVRSNSGAFAELRYSF